MNPFDQRWLNAAKLAHQAEPPRDDSAPFGFATRVVAQWPAPENTALLWQRLLARTLGVMTAVLIIVATFVEVVDRDREPLRLPVEDTVGDLFCLQ